MWRWLVSLWSNRGGRVNHQLKQFGLDWIPLGSGFPFLVYWCTLFQLQKIYWRLKIKNISFGQSSKSKFSVQDKKGKHFCIPFTFATNNNKSQALKSKGTKLYNQGLNQLVLLTRFSLIYKSWLIINVILLNNILLN